MSDIATTTAPAIAAPARPATLLPVPARAIEKIVLAALEEDNPRGDLTGNVLIPAGTTATAAVIAREPGICAGLETFIAAMKLTDPALELTPALADGEPFATGDTLVTVSGPARGLLAGERVGLNLLQRMSGIATATAAFVKEAEGTGARIVDTRKTTPGLRVLERYAVRCGGGHNHRDNLSEAVMAKDNHLALLGSGSELTAALRQARGNLGHTVHFEVEIDSLDQLDAVLAAGVDTIMLDNFSLADLATGVRRIAGAALVEASGNVRLETVAAIAATGVDVISSGALTHSVRALDLGLDIAIDHGRGANTP
ncbi:carboxylating nicotinate-nucleotide diphosphorylase [Paeniglutamicibacter psychrophenolicus]|uniref:nicotinate-nucleotide diphosphorylase (carboxylating) n=1 Tax=Paeniglutamicibacter psychrophenolicus TaxID=257454 RepID=A0ABS4WFI4_9MICC|nr:nicotinate-nucleotide pyrophosphorylase (carboxylating) [Paeniglutamicibacter psychrophenolicus]